MVDYPTIRVRSSGPAQGGAPSVAVVFCEPTGRWAAAARRALAGIEVPIRQTRSPAECLAEIERYPAAVVGVALGPRNLPLVAQLARQAEVRYPLVEWVLLGECAEGLPRELPLELGAAFWAQWPRQLHQLRRLVAEQLARYPGRPPGLVESIVSDVVGQSPGPAGKPGA